jgi:nucleoside-specific outer membrane channel protein Tsx
MKRVLYVVVLLASSYIAAFAQNWSSANIQYLYGGNFDRLIGENSSKNGEVQTITIEYSGGWDYGRNFFFIDMMSGDFSNGKEQTIYAEWIPKLSLSKISGTELWVGIIKDVFLAGEINQGDNFRAYNIGAGVALDVKGFDFVDMSLYHRKDNYNEATFQFASAWKSSFKLSSVPLVFEGFFDYYGVDYGEEIISQPRLLLEGNYFGNATKTLQMGTEIYCYHSSAAPWRKEINELIPQLMVKWIW